MWRQVRGVGYEVAFEGSEYNSIIEPQLKPNGVKLGLIVKFVHLDERENISSKRFIVGVLSFTPCTVDKKARRCCKG